MPDKQLLSQFFSNKLLEDYEEGYWSKPTVGFNLLIFVIIKFMLEVTAISCPIPAGVFFPTFLLGAGFGRFYGHCLRLIFGKTINVAVYSIIGAA